MAPLPSIFRSRKAPKDKGLLRCKACWEERPRRKFSKLAIFILLSIVFATGTYFIDGYTNNRVDKPFVWADFMGVLAVCALWVLRELHHKKNLSEILEDIQEELGETQAAKRRTRAQAGDKGGDKDKGKTK